MSRPRTKNNHLPPCVYPKHGAYYYVKGGKWERLGDTLASALRAYSERFESPQLGGLDGLIDRTLEKKRREVSVNTLKQYGIAARRLKKIFAEFGSPAEVKPIHVVGLRRGLAATPNMANRILSFTREVFDLALEEELIDSNPAIGVKRLAEAQRERLVTIEELRRIYAESGPRLRVIIDLLVRTGKRINQVLAIKRADITEAGISFGKQKTDIKGLVRWSPELREVVDRARELYGNLVAITLLHNRRGKAPDYRTVREQWEKACARAGVEDAHLHDLRATAATYTEEQGGDPTALLAHVNPSNTKRYLRSKKPKVADPPSFGRLFDKQAK